LYCCSRQAITKALTIRGPNKKNMHGFLWLSQEVASTFQHHYSYMSL
jgi:hypothetical protein